MATKIESSEITQPKKVYVKSEEALDEMEVNGQLEPFTDYYTDDDLDAPFMPVGSIFASAIPQEDARVHLLDGSTILQTGVYETFANLIKALVSAGNPINCTQSQFDTDVSATGNCGKFVIDDTNGTIRLPKITTFIQGLSNITNIGSSLSAGLPNITGNFYTYNYDSATTSGTFKQIVMADNGNSVGTSSTQYVSVELDASKGEIKTDGTRRNDVYGKNDTVQPNATQYPYYIVLASGYKSSQVVDIDNIMNELNNNQGIKFAETERLKTINLFSSKLEQGSIASADGTLSSNDTRVRTANYISLKAGTYTISNKDKYLIPIVYDTSGNHIPYELSDGWVTSTTFTFTITNDRLIKFVFRNTDNSTIKPADVTELMLVEGNSAQPYQEYNGDIVHQAGGVMTGQLKFEGMTDKSILVENSSGDCMMKFTRTDTGNAISFGVGSGGQTRGMWDEKLGYWLVHCDGSKLKLKGPTTRPTYNDNDMALYSDVINLGRFVSVGSTSGTRYYPLVRFNKAISDGNNYSGVFLNGRIGGWGYDNMAYINAFFWGRDKRGGEYTSIGQITNALARADFVMYEESSTSVVLYLKINGYALARFSFSGSGEGVTNLYDGSYITSTPTGTLIASMANGTISEKKTGDVLYDMSSSSSSINWGYKSGIMGGVTVSGKDFSKYSKLIVSAIFANEMCGTGIVDLKKVAPNPATYKVRIIAGAEVDNDIYTCGLYVSSDKTSISNVKMGFLRGSSYSDRTGNSNYYIYRIVGVV